jgi:DNA-binding response OmpR family regulator
MGQTGGPLVEHQSRATPVRELADSSVSVRSSILIAEDQPLLAEFMASVAMSHGFEVEIADTASQFDQKVQESPPDAIMTDLVMPDRDGIELMRFLASARYAGPILIISACDRRVIETSTLLGREMGLNISAAAQKPITEEHLTEMLDQAMRDRSGR